MELSLTAVSPVDGRYGDKVNALRGIFSSTVLLKFRVYKVKYVGCRNQPRTQRSRKLPLSPLHANGYLDTFVANLPKMPRALKPLSAPRNHVM